jgi:bifunctional non-homologous end joining protein LigD
MEHITLYFRQGSSDKVYQAGIESADGGFVVRFAYGRRGTTLQTGTKTSAPVVLSDARRIFDKLVAEKTAKGYSPGESGTPYLHTDKAALTTGIQCQLLNAIEADEVERYIGNDDYWMQEKFDGRRMLIQKKGRGAIAINRQSLAVALPLTLVGDAANCPSDFIIDGEALGDVLCAFDVLSIGNEDLRTKPFLERHLRLMSLMKSFPHPHILLPQTACTTDEKRSLFNTLKALGKEGVTFKKITGLYTAGRPGSGGSQLKYKFYETASFIVGKVNAKRSVSLLLDEGGKLVDAGNVTIPPNHHIPTKGSIVECRYLYAFRESGSIYQPAYLGERCDLSAAECTTDQLKYKTSQENT